MLKWMRDHSVMKAAWDKLEDIKKGEAIGAGKFPIGLLYESSGSELDYDAAYDQVIERAGGAGK
jgi:2-oxoglutarate ferredoxin oxidoreductase subunit beta